MSSSRPRILILGSLGGLGRALTRHLAALGEITAWSRADLDLSEVESIAPRLKTQRFDVLLNPAGLTSPDVCEAQPMLARRVNAEAPAALAEGCRQHGARFIHFSTDYVFDGSKTSLWSEDDTTHPVNEYGRSKLAGEQAVLAAYPEALVARVSWLFGPDKAAHPDQIIAKAMEGGDLSAIADKTSAPTYTRDLCHWIAQILLDHPGLQGPLHLCNSGAASWHGWGEASLQAAAAFGLPVRTKLIQPTRLAESTFFKAARPPHTAMSTARFTRLTGITPRPWQEALAEYLRGKAPLAF